MCRLLTFVIFLLLSTCFGLSDHLSILYDNFTHSLSHTHTIAITPPLLLWWQTDFPFLCLTSYPSHFCFGLSQAVTPCLFFFFQLFLCFKWMWSHPSEESRPNSRSWFSKYSARVKRRANVMLYIWWFSAEEAATDKELADAFFGIQWDYFGRVVWASADWTQQ